MKKPPQLFLRFFRWYCHPRLQPYIEGDLMEVYNEQREQFGKRSADLKFIRDVVLLCRPGIIKPVEGYRNLNPYGMYKSYFKIGWRNLVKNKGYSFINMGGLALGMAVAVLIGLWIWDELSFNKYHQNYDSIAQVMEQDIYNGTVVTGAAIPLPLDAEMRAVYGSDFKHIVMTAWTNNHTLIAGDKKISYPGNFIGAEGPDMLSLNMLQGTRQGLADPSSMLISQAVSTALFGAANPLGELIKLDDKVSFKVAGVYEDLPLNSSFHDMAFMAPWNFYVNAQDWIQRDPANWSDNSLFMYVQVADQADMAMVSAKIKDIKLNHVGPGAARLNPAIFLQPMNKWHLYSRFKNGVNAGGAIENVWLFGIIGIFVLLLACINFMNLSTARSEKRAKEVGIRKAVGSQSRQLISQFFCESMLTAMLAFLLSIVLVQLALPFFNEVANKEVSIWWTSPFFWLAGVGFALLTGLIAGSYPALYLSSFKPVKVLKGTFKAGAFAAVPRRVLVVLQFTVSVVLIIGTIIVFNQIQFAKNRPVGYSRDGLLYIETSTHDLHDHFDVLRAELLQSGAVAEVSESTSPTTGVNNNRNDIAWEGKDPAMTSSFGQVAVTSGYGQTVGWQFKEGKNFIGRFHTDSSSVVINEAAVKYMGLKNPVGEIISVGKRDLVIIGVIQNMVMDSPYDPIKQTIFRVGKGDFEYVNIKIKPGNSIHEALAKIEAICKVYAPSVPFTYRFADDEYAKKFSSEERIGKLTTFFSALAIFISCIGLFGMASFMAEQRTKEIGIRKVLGASVLNVWKMLSREFVMLVIISLVIAIPVAYYLMNSWLEKYEYRTHITGWVFVIAGTGALALTILTVSYQSVKAAVVNPVKSLRSE